ncbi:NAD(+)/NADH kinase [Methanospirillum sp.]|uniref:NAD(+)/NADH kinase n=1 Tax=Methanospirillum sp. TaxID=45200 RepID=UPI0035A15238
MNILIVNRYGDPQIDLFSNDLEKLLIQNGYLTSTYKENLLEKSSQIFNPVNPPDLIIVLGGDGTILLATQRMPLQVPLVGINYGEVGFLADLEPEDMSSFITLLKEPLQLETRMRIELRINGKVIGTALNEALIITDRPAKMLKFLIHINGKVAEQFRADGLIISTPTGSTAYAMSAGGPIVDPRVEGFLMVPLAPFMLSNRPHLIDSSRTVSITLETTKPAKLVIDGQTEIHLDANYTVEISKSANPALFLDVGQNFFEKINRKLRHL